MEIACEVLKKSSSINTLKNISKVQKKFKQLNLCSASKKLGSTSFMKMISDKKTIIVAKEFLSQYFENVNDDMGFGLLMGYYIVSYHNNIFGDYISKMENKLIISASKLINIINIQVNEQQQHRELTNLFDVYYSLYKVWQSKDSITSMTESFETIKEITHVMNCKSKKDYTHILIDRIDIMFNIHPTYTTRIILHNYNIFNNMLAFKTHFWNKFKEIKDKDTAFVIAVVELKIQLIPKLTDPKDRKNIYYNIDTENIINQISTSTFTHSKKHEIINILESTIKKVNNKFVGNGEFSNMFDCLY